MASHLLPLLVAAVFASAAHAAVPTVPIAPNVNMPVVGLGSCCGTYNVTAWIEQGNRHIDTSCDYGSQGTIGEAIRASGIPRSAFFITSKVDPEDYGNDIAAAFEKEVLQPLQMEYVDLLLMHHAGRVKGDKRPLPSCFNASDANGRGTFYTCRLETWRGLLEIEKTGKARAVGVSNFEVRELNQLFNDSRRYPSVNQIEHHPYWHTDELVEFCNANNISVTAYAPAGAFPRSDMLDDPHLTPLAAKYKKSKAQVALRWELQKGADVVIPRSKTPAHMQENVDIFDFQLTDDEVSALSALPQNKIYATQCQPWC